MPSSIGVAGAKPVSRTIAGMEMKMIIDAADRFRRTAKAVNRLISLRPGSCEIPESHSTGKSKEPRWDSHDLTSTATSNHVAPSS